MNYSRILFPNNWTDEEIKLGKEILSELVMSKAENVNSTKTGETIKLLGEAVTLYDYMIGCIATNDNSESKLLHELFKLNWPKEYSKLNFDCNARIILIDWFII